MNVEKVEETGTFLLGIRTNSSCRFLCGEKIDVSFLFAKGFEKKKKWKVLDYSDSARGKSCAKSQRQPVTVKCSFDV